MRKYRSSYTRIEYVIQVANSETVGYDDCVLIGDTTDFTEQQALEIYKGFVESGNSEESFRLIRRLIHTSTEYLDSTYKEGEQQ